MENKLEIVKEYIIRDQKKFYRLAYSYVQNEQDALDIVQNAVCKALQNCQGIRNIKYLRTWFYRVLVNESIDFIKQKKEEIPFEKKLFEKIGEEKEEEESSEQLYQKINLLTPEIQTVIKLRYFEDFSLLEIARCTDQNLSTVKSRLYRGLGQLRREMEHDEF